MIRIFMIFLVTGLVAHITSASQVSSEKFKQVVFVDNKIIDVEEAHVFELIPGVPATAAYGVIKNISSEKIKLSVIKAEGFAQVEIHTTVKEDDRMEMRMIPDIEIKPNSFYLFEPGNNHIMLLQPAKKNAAVLGNKIKITFLINGKEFIEIPFTVVAREKGRR